MTAAALAAVVAGIQAAVSAAPMVEDVIVKAKAFITSLFTAGLISAATQDSLHAYVDAVVTAAINGTVAPEYQVQPDPA
jgi:hypothetical protein